jgi:putative metallohydrolase (TIGR04338 family)
VDRDSGRSAVYAAEQLVHRLLDRAAASGRSGGGTISIAGSRVTVPAERRFASLESIQRYVDAVLALNWVRQGWARAAVPVTVRARRGAAAAHYERRRACIAVPVGGNRWALRELVVLHELAHHLTPDSSVDREGGEAAHGPAFVGRLLDLVDGVVGPEVAFVLRVTFGESGVFGGPA